MLKYIFLIFIFFSFTIAHIPVDIQILEEDVVIQKIQAVAHQLEHTHTIIFKMCKIEQFTKKLKKRIDLPMHDSFLYPIKMDKEIYLVIRYLSFDEDVEEIVSENGNIRYQLHVSKQSKHAKQINLVIHQHNGEKTFLKKLKRFVQMEQPTELEIVLKPLIKKVRNEFRRVCQMKDDL